MIEYEEPTERQVDFATTIAETVGKDLPEHYDKYSYGEFISENIDEFYKVQNEIRYADGMVFHLHHSYGLGEGFCGDSELNVNPMTV